MGRCKAVLPGRLQIVGKIGSQTNFWTYLSASLLTDEGKNIASLFT